MDGYSVLCSDLCKDQDELLSDELRGVMVSCVYFNWARSFESLSCHVAMGALQEPELASIYIFIYMFDMG